jgi:hypothetical protein
MGPRPNQSIDRSHEAIWKHEQRRLARLRTTALQSLSRTVCLTVISEKQGFCCDRRQLHSPFSLYFVSLVLANTDATPIFLCSVQQDDDTPKWQELELTPLPHQQLNAHIDAIEDNKTT